MTCSLFSRLRRSLPMLAAISLMLPALDARAEPGDEICFPLYMAAGAVPGTGMRCTLIAAAARVDMGTFWCTGEPDRIERYCGTVKPPPPPPPGQSGRSTIQCDGHGNYEVVNNSTGPARACTQIHEESHIRDWKERYGAESCKGKPRGFWPSSPVNGDDYKDFLRDSECRAYTEAKTCMENANDGGKALLLYQVMFRENYCAEYDTWKRPKKKKGSAQ